MASPPATSPRLMAAAAAAVAVMQALLSVTGPWQPASIILGWLAVVFVGVTLLTGYAGGLAIAAGVSVVRVGVEAVSGEVAGGPVLAAVLLAALIELTSASLEARRTPLEPRAVLARTVVVAAVTGIAVGLLVLGAGVTRPSGPGWNLVGVAAAVVVTGTILSVQRRRIRD